MPLSTARMKRAMAKGQSTPSAPQFTPDWRTQELNEPGFAWTYWVIQSPKGELSLTDAYPHGKLSKRTKIVARLQKVDGKVTRLEIAERQLHDNAKFLTLLTRLLGGSEPFPYANISWMAEVPRYAHWDALQTLWGWFEWDKCLWATTPHVASVQFRALLEGGMMIRLQVHTQHKPRWTSLMSHILLAKNSPPSLFPLPLGVEWVDEIPQDSIWK